MILSKKSYLAERCKIFIACRLPGSENIYKQGKTPLKISTIFLHKLLKSDFAINFSALAFVVTSTHDSK
jgi:hypothetical protein